MESKLSPVNVELQVGDVHVTEIIHPGEKQNLNEDLLIKLQPDLGQQMSEINKHLSEVSQKFTYWGLLRAIADKKEKEVKQELKMWLAGKKKELLEKGVKYTSETAKEDAVITQNVDEYAQFSKKLIESEYNKNALDVIKDAWVMKKDMLITLSAQLRQEVNLGYVPGNVQTANNKVQDVLNKGGI